MNISHLAMKLSHNPARIKEIIKEYGGSYNSARRVLMYKIYNKLRAR